MSRRINAYVEVDLTEFDDDDVLEYARSLGYLSSEAALFSDLAYHIGAGHTDDALATLAVIARNEGSTFAEAIEIGRRRAR